MLGVMEISALEPQPARTGKANLLSIAHGADQRRLDTASFYESHAEAYAATTMTIDMSGRLTNFVARLPAYGRVLDAGCGAGRDLIGLRDAGLDAIGLDLSPALAAVARRVSGMAVQVGDLRAPPFEPLSFEGIWAMASLHHLERNETVGALRVLRNLLVPGGVLFASVKRGAGLARDADGRWFTLHDAVGWRQLLTSAGFWVDEVVGEPIANLSTNGVVLPGWISSISRRPE